MPSIDSKEKSEATLGLQDLLETLLTDESLSDVSLHCTDGQMISANRCILAARSSVFRQMLFGNFTETSDALIRVDYSSDVIQAVVEFIYTDDAEILEAATLGAIAFDPSLAKTVVYIASAALHFGLTELFEKVQTVGCQIMDEHEESACSFLEANRMAGESLKSCDIEQKAFQKIRSNPSLILKSKTLPSLSSSTLEEILDNEYIETEELSIFYIIQEWLNSYAKSIMKPDEAQIESRRDLAKKLTNLIRLENIDPNQLSSIVSSSGLVTEARLNEAYKMQAFEAASSNKESMIGRPRYRPTKD